MVVSLATITVILDVRAQRRDKAMRQWWAQFYAAHDPALDSALGRAPTIRVNVASSPAPAQSSPEPIPSGRSRPALPYVGAEALPEREAPPTSEIQGSSRVRPRVVDRLPNEDETRISRFDGITALDIRPHVETIPPIPPDAGDDEDQTSVLMRCSACKGVDVRPTGGVWRCNTCNHVGAALRPQPSPDAR